MFQSTADDGVSGTVNRWSRFLGVSLRPWSGYSPLGLIIRGAIQVAICGFFIKVFTDLTRGEGFTMTEAEASSLRGFGILALIVLAVLLLTGAAKVLVGVLDFVPRKTLSGTVLSVRSRQFLDFLPRPVQRMIFERDGKLDNRKLRTEVVMNTDTGIKQWTVRNAKFDSHLQVGATVNITVSPLIGFVAAVTTTEAPTD